MRPPVAAICSSWLGVVCGAMAGGKQGVDLEFLISIYVWKMQEHAKHTQKKHEIPLLLGAKAKLHECRCGGLGKDF